MGLKKFNILISCIGATGAQNIIKIFKKQKELSMNIVGVDNQKYTAGQYFCDNFYKVPLAFDKGYISSIVKICLKENIRIFIPIWENEIEVVSKKIKIFKEKNILVPISSERTISICNDKLKLYDFFRKNNIETIKTTKISNKNGDKLNYPIFIKPAFGTGSKNCYKVSNKQEFIFYLNKVENPIIQDYIVGEEFSIDTFSDLDGTVIGIVPRKRIEIKMGIATKSITVRDNKIIKKTEDILNKLKIIGPANLQCFKTRDNKIIFFEINPRFGGSYILSFKAGLNIPKYFSQMVKGEKIKPTIGEFRDSLYMVRYLDEIFVMNED